MAVVATRLYEDKYWTNRQTTIALSDQLCDHNALSLICYGSPVVGIRLCRSSLLLARRDRAELLSGDNSERHIERSD